jgi:hypothetical protein
MDTTVGYVLLGAAVVPGAMGYGLSLGGLKKVEEVANKASETHKEATEAVTNAQVVTAQATGDDATKVAAANTQVAEKADNLSSALGSVEEALKGMTGPLAPARVFLSLTLLLVVASLFPLGVISVSA